MENDYENWTLMQLTEREEALIEYIELSKTAVSKPGGWIIWNGDNEERAERDLQDVQYFIRKIGGSD